MGAPDVDTTCGGSYRHRLPGSGTRSGLQRRHRSRPGDQCQPDHGQCGGKRQRRRPALPGRQRHGRAGLPDNACAVVLTSRVTNNIIANNVAGWDGAGISLQDALNVNIINNTIVSNYTTASAGSALQHPWGSPGQFRGSQSASISYGTTSCPQACRPGEHTEQHGAERESCRRRSPARRTTIRATTATNGTCRTFSLPAVWITMCSGRTARSTSAWAPSAAQYQQNVVALYNAFTTTLAPSQPQTDATTAHGAGLTITGGTGACVAANYWDIGVRGDTGPSNHASGVTLAPMYSVLTRRRGLLRRRIAQHRVQPELRQPVLQRLADSCRSSERRAGPGAAGHLGRHRAQPDLQPDSGRDGGRGQQLDQHAVGARCRC